jgi:3-oxoacyl-[acyl-carrier-protein] synthase II
MHPVAITACSLLTPFDTPASPDATWTALRAGKRLAARTAVDDQLLRGPTTLDRSIRMALAVAEKVLTQAEIENPPFALFCGTSKGPVLTLLAALERRRHGEPLLPEQARHVQLGVGAMGACLAEHLGLDGPVHTSVAACASGMFALHRAAGALRRGECRRALVVAADASLHPLFEASFARLGVLAPREADGSRRCDPFGEAGRGFFLSEAAAALMLEPAETAHQPPALLDATWIGADGTGLIAVDPGTATLRAGLSRLAAEDIAFVHAHATGTAHDRFELAAIQTALPALAREQIFSHKGALGHTLGAAGLVSVALSVLAHRHGVTPTGFAVRAGARSLTLAQGLGGHIGRARLRGK